MSPVSARMLFCCETCKGEGHHVAFERGLPWTDPKSWPHWEEPCEDCDGTGSELCIQCGETAGSWQCPVTGEVYCDPCRSAEQREARRA